MQQYDPDDFLSQIADFMASHSMSQSRFGILSVNNPNFVARMHDGTSPTLRTVQKVCGWMDDFELAEQKNDKEEAARAVSY